MRPGEGVPTAASIIYMRNSDRAKKKTKGKQGGRPRCIIRQELAGMEGRGNLLHGTPGKKPENSQDAGQRD